MPSELITTARGITSPEVFVLVTKIYPDKHLVLHGGLQLLSVTRLLGLTVWLRQVSVLPH